MDEVLLAVLLFGIVSIAGVSERVRNTILTLPMLYTLFGLGVALLLADRISLIGSHLRPQSVLFMGWFGPRGIASILYVLLVMGEPGIGSKEIIFNAAMLTVFFSILLHGVTAAPLANWYGKRMGAMQAQGTADAEAQSVQEVATRSGAFS